MQNPYLAWKYKRELIITNPSSTEGVQVSFELPYSPGMRADFRDIRFSDAYGAKIPYAIESIVDFTSAVIWVKLPADAPVIYLHYGNGAVVSASDTSAVFELYDNFNTFWISGKWNLEHGSALLSNSILVIGDKTLNSIVQSSDKFGINTLVEIRANHCGCLANKAIFGFRDLSTEHAVAWHGSTSAIANDHRFSHNGSSGTWTNDGVNRGGTTYYTYKVVRLASSALYYVNDAYRGTVTTTMPPSNSMIPVQFYVSANHTLRINWVRVRKYSAVMPVITLGRKFTTQPKGYPWDNSISDAHTKIEMRQAVNIKSTLKEAHTQIEMKGKVMFRQPLYYNPQINSQYPAWKYSGEIELEEQESPARVRLPIQPGMAVDGRDLRFTDMDDRELEFNIFNITQDFLDIWIDYSYWEPFLTSDSKSFKTSDFKIFNSRHIPQLTKIKFYYGNGVATTKSNPAVIGTKQYETLVTVTPHIEGIGDVWPLYGWKYQQEIKLSDIAAGGEQILLSIQYRPGMTEDGRDFRFFDLAGNKLSYYLESYTFNEFSVWVRLPAGSNKIIFFFGNGAAVSESSASEVFDLFDDFEGDFLSQEWTVQGGTATVSNSNLVIGATDRNSLVRGTSVFGPGTILEMRMYHPSQNQTICGFWSATNQRACWLGGVGTNYNDHTQTYDGSAYTNTDDGVDRGGSIFYKYGISYETKNLRFFINGVLRQSMVDTLPSGDIPISFYSVTNKGNLVVDWVRVRKITHIIGTLGKLKRQTGVTYNETTEETTEEIIPEIKISHRPQWQTPQIYYDYISASSSYLSLHPSEPVFKERRELGDYAIVSCEVTKSINDAYSQLSTEFQNLTVPPEGSTIKHNAYDAQGNPHLIFHGKVITNSPTHGLYSQTVKMQAADQTLNLVTQPVPWNFQIVDTTDVSIQTWINRLLDPVESGVYPNTIIDTHREPRQFIFSPKTSRLEAIKQLASYAGCLYQTKLMTREVDGHIITRPEFYFVPPERIDEPVNGFDLPAPLILDANDCKLASDPQVVNESEEKYNSVIVHGVLSENGESVVAQALSYEVYTGEAKAKVYTIEDNAITEKASTAEREAIKWLLYFLSERVTVSMSFVDRFDFELYQRIRFGKGFSNKLQGLTQSTQVKYVAACDPRDVANSTHLVEVSGVPRPRWLRISDLKYSSEHLIESVQVTAITDMIYSVVDPIVTVPWSDYLSPGYYKPIIDDLVDTTQSIVEDNIAKQLTPESCTVLSINEENNTAVVQTASGKLVTVSLA